MLTSLTIAKRIGTQAQKQPTLAETHAILTNQGLAWERTEIAFHADRSSAGSIKSLKAIARENTFLQPHFQQKVIDAAATQARGGWPPVWNTQNFAEAMADKNKKQAVRHLIEWALPARAPDCEETLRLIDAILAAYPQKNYQYRFHARFVGLRFGEDTLAELPEDYARGRGPFVEDRANDVLADAPWAHSAVQFVNDRYGTSLLVHCLLGESHNAPGKKDAMPDGFVRLATALFPFKAKEVTRRVIRSVHESDDHFARLTAEQRRDLDGKILAHIIGLERALYLKTAGHDFPQPLPAADDNQTMYAYLVTVGRAVNQANKDVVRAYNLVTIIQEMRQAAARAMQDGTFTSVEALELSPPEKEERRADSQRREQLIEAAMQAAGKHLEEVAAEGKMPHRLERYYFPEGLMHQVGLTEDGRVILASRPSPDPAKTSYVPYHQIWVPDDQPVPASLQALGYERDRVRRQLEQLMQFLLQSYRRPEHAMAYLKKAYIDGGEYPVVAADREKMNRRKILGTVFKPLGYEFVKQPRGSVGNYELKKYLSEKESLRCVFDFGTWRQTIDCFFAYDGDKDETTRGKAFRMRLTGWSYPQSVAIWTEELFTKAIENIGALVDILEKDHVPRLRQALSEGRGD
jgi:hypothetical protein